MASVRQRFWHGDSLVLLLLVTLSLTLMISGERVRQESARVLHSVVYYPLEKALATGRSLWTLRQENRRWRSVANELAAENARLAEAAEENARLRRALGFHQSVPGRMLPAEVIGRRGGFLEPTLIADQGSLAGVREDMAVVCPEGLVGRVYDVAPRISWILPLVHPDCRVSALVRRSRVLGIVEWRPGRELVLAKIPRLADVAPGDLVVSSGLGGVFPAGWPVGEAVGLTEEFGGLLNHVRLTPRVDFNRLEEVFILLESAAPEGEELGGYPPGHEPEDAAGRGAETP